VLIVALGLAGLFLRVGQLGDELLGLLRVSVELATKVLPWLLVWAVLRQPPESFYVDWGPILSALSGLWSSVSTLAVRVALWLQALVLGKPDLDPVAATLVWGMTLWLVAAWAGWTLRRRGRPLLALAPGGILLVAALSYQQTKPTLIPILLGAMLLLLGLEAYANRQRRWQASGIDYPDLATDTTLVVLLVTFVLVVSAVVSPVITIQNLVDFIDRFGPQEASGPGGGVGGGAPASSFPGKEQL
jgi:hypothetical protein